MADVPSGDDQHTAKLKDVIQAGKLVALITEDEARELHVIAGMMNVTGVRDHPGSVDR